MGDVIAFRGSEKKSDNNGSDNNGNVDSCTACGHPLNEIECSMTRRLEYNPATDGYKMDDEDEITEKDSLKCLKCGSEI